MDKDLVVKIRTLEETLVIHVHSHIQSVLFRTTLFVRKFSNVLVNCSYMGL